MKTLEDLDIKAVRWPWNYISIANLRRPFGQLSALPSSITVVASLQESDSGSANIASAIFLEKAVDVTLDKMRLLGVIGRALLYSEGHPEVLDELRLNLISVQMAERAEVIVNAAYYSQKIFDDIR